MWRPCDDEYHRNSFRSRSLVLLYRVVPGHRVNHQFPDKLSTKRLVLRRLRSDDVEAICGYRSKPEVARFQSWETYEREEGERLVEGQVNMEPGIPGTWLQVAIVEQATGTMVGDCGLHCLKDEPRQMELGVTLDSDYQGRGYATEALSCLLDFVFGTLNAHRVFAVTGSENVSAEALFLRLGFRKEAHFIEHRWYKGYWDSEFVFGLLSREWVTAQG